jgi:hypothetical protein
VFEVPSSEESLHRSESAKVFCVHTSMFKSRCR